MKKDPGAARPGVGLALSGGGARGLAHIGVLKAIEAENVPIECLCGTSMGGIVAAAYAAGWRSQDLEAEALRMSRMRELVTLLDPRPPRRGLLAGRRLRDYLARFLDPELRFEDLPLPLGLIAVDLDCGEVVQLREGYVLEAVLATCAFPGVLPPATIHGRRPVDGGLLNNLPVDLARQMGSQAVIAVDVTPKIGGDHTPTPVQLLPGLAEDLFKSVVIMSNALTESRLRSAPPDLLIRPKTPPGIGTFSGFTQARGILLAGEEAAREALPQLELGRLGEN